MVLVVTAHVNRLILLRITTRLQIAIVTADTVKSSRENPEKIKKAGRTTRPNTIAEHAGAIRLHPKIIYLQNPRFKRQIIRKTKPNQNQNQAPLSIIRRRIPIRGRRHNRHSLIIRRRRRYIETCMCGICIRNRHQSGHCVGILDTRAW